MNRLKKASEFLRKTCSLVCFNVHTFYRNNQKGLFLIAILIVYGFIYALNRLTPLLSDDFIYSFIYETEHRLTGMSDIFRSLYKHYYEWGGRLVAHFFAQSFLFYGKGIFNFFNAGMYVLLSLLLYFHINTYRPVNLKLFFIIHVLMWFLIPAFGETTLWLTGSCNYLWCAVIIFTFLLPYRLYAVKPKFRFKTLLLIPYIPLSFFAGWTNENTGGAMILAAIFFILYYKFILKASIPKWAVVALILAVVGYVIMAIAPGNAIRAAQGYNERNIFIKLAYRTIMVTVNLYGYGIYPLLFIAAILLVLIKNIGRQNKEFYLVVAIYFTAAMGAAYSMILVSSDYTPRSWFGLACFMFITIGILYIRIADNNMVRRLTNCILLFVLVPFFVSCWDAFKDARYVSDFVENRTSYIIEQQKSGEKYLEVEHIKAKERHNPRFYVSDEIDWNADNHWTKTASRYYGLDSIKAVKPNIYNIDR